MKTKDGWTLRPDGLAHKAPACPLGGRHIARKVPRDGTLPRCERCGSAFSYAVLPINELFCGSFRGGER